MWLANLEDGRTISEHKSYWTDLKPETKMTGLQLIHPNLPKMFICLSNYDKYYFAREAISTLPSISGKPRIVAEIIGGHDSSLGIGIEVRLEMSGSVRVKTYPIARFKYAPTILHDGKRNGTPGYAASPDVIPVLKEESSTES